MQRQVFVIRRGYVSEHQAADRPSPLTITLKMAARSFLPRCIAFFNQIPIGSSKIRNSNAMRPGRKFLAAIFSLIVDSFHLLWDAKVDEFRKK